MQKAKELKTQAIIDRGVKIAKEQQDSVIKHLAEKTEQVKSGSVKDKITRAALAQTLEDQSPEDQIETMSSENVSNELLNQIFSTGGEDQKKSEVNKKQNSVQDNDEKVFEQAAVMLDSDENNSEMSAIVETEASKVMTLAKVKSIAVQLGLDCDDTTAKQLSLLGTNSAITEALVSAAITAGKSEAEIEAAMTKR